MAYDSSCNYGEYYDIGEYYNGEYSLAPHYDSYDCAHSFQDSVAYSSSPQYFYENQSYDPASDSVSRIAYSAATFSQPIMSLEYDPGPYYQEQTRFITSYHVSEFNEPEFEAYDPTPYGGGYDLAETYGKPLPPSDKICYPRSTPTPDPKGSPLNGSIGASYGEDEVEKTQSESKPSDPPPAAAAIDEAAPVQPPEHGNGNVNSQEKCLDLEEDKEDEETYVDGGYGNGARRELPDYEYGEQIPSAGCGLEAVDLCESLFGYWPCLSGYRRLSNDCQEEAAAGCENQWKVEAVDYLFRSSNNSDPYSGRRDDGEGFSGKVVYGYERHFQFQEEPLHYEVEDSW